MDKTILHICNRCGPECIGRLIPWNGTTTGSILYGFETTYRSWEKVPPESLCIVSEGHVRIATPEELLKI